MKTTRRLQKGGSAVVNIILLLALAYGAYVGIGYAPLFMESRTIDSILNNVRLANGPGPAQGRHEIEGMIDRELALNSMSHMRSKFEVQRLGDGYEIQVRYERPLNVVYAEKKVIFQKSLVLK